MAGNCGQLWGMGLFAAENSDSQAVAGGHIPGLDGVCAFHLYSPAPSAIPVLISVPHAGRAYPPEILGNMRNPALAAQRLEDRLVDQLGKAVARQTGAALLVAHAPRAMIDLNRAEQDVDWGMFEGQGGASSPPPGLRARSGLGLIPRRLPGTGELWSRPHSRADMAARLAGVHQPYHRCLAETLAGLRARWGAALVIDLHSMPPLGVPGGPPGAQFVLGDRFGASCHGGLVAHSVAYFAATARQAAHNQPYAGGYVLERHAAPQRGLHGFQLEIDRARYLDPALRELGDGFSGMTEVLCGLVRRLAREVAQLGSGHGRSAWAEAAE